LGVIAPDRLAAMNAREQQPPSLHSAEFYPDPVEALTTGMDTMIHATLDLLPVGSRN